MFQDRHKIVVYYNFIHIRLSDMSDQNAGSIFSWMTTNNTTVRWSTECKYANVKYNMKSTPRFKGRFCFVGDM